MCTGEKKKKIEGGTKMKQIIEIPKKLLRNCLLRKVASISYASCIVELKNRLY